MAVTIPRFPSVFSSLYLIPSFSNDFRHKEEKMTRLEYSPMIPHPSPFRRRCTHCRTAKAIGWWHHCSKPKGQYHSRYQNVRERRITKTRRMYFRSRWQSMRGFTWFSERNTLVERGMSCAESVLMIHLLTARRVRQCSSCKHINRTPTWATLV